MKAQTHAQALEISTPDDWGQTHGLISDALTAIAFAHPACAAAELRMRLDDHTLIARIENTRRSRLGSSWIELGSADQDADSREPAMPASASRQVESLSEAIRCLKNEALPLLAGSPAFARAFGNNLGLGLSERWDGDHADGIERSGDGLSAFEEATLAASESFPLTTLLAARAGSQFLQGEAKDCAQGVLAELEAQGIQEQAPAPAQARPRSSKSL